MLKWTRVVFMVVWVVLLAACAAPEHKPLPMGSLVAQVQSPKLVSGQQWTYRRVDLWNDVEQERFSQTLDKEVEGRWQVWWNILSAKDESRQGTTSERMSAPTQSFADPRMTGRHEPLKFPLSPGKTWSFSYKFQSKPDTSVSVEQTAVVARWESVTVPAGTFRALRIDHTGHYTATQASKQWRGRITETYWYAPDVLRVVAMEYRDTTGFGTTWEQRRDELVDMRLTPVF